MQRIKENVTQREYTILMNFVRGDEKMRENTKLNILRTFTLLYYTGIRVNETQELLIKHIKELLEKGFVKFETKKTSTERKLYLSSDDFKKDLLKVFDFETEDDENKVIAKGSNKNKRTGISPIVFITKVNSIMKEALGSGYTSHSFRQGILTEMGSKSVNVKVISKFIGHKDVKTTLRYINPTDEDILNSLIR